MSDPTPPPPPRPRTPAPLDFAPPAEEERPRKLRTALLLTLFFGPLGLFYVSTWGALLMCAITFAAAISTVGIALVPCWIVCLIWAFVSTASDFGSAPDTGVPYDEAKKEE